MALLLAAVAVVLAIRVRLLAMPLERDEGEFAYMGQLMLQGIPPYAAAYNLKFPGIYGAYALLMAVLGQTPTAIHLGFALVNLATIGLVYALAWRLFDRYTAAVAGASYAVLSVSVSVLGLAAHATHFVVILAVGGLLVLLKATESDRPGSYLGAGILLGLAYTMKQPGALLTLFGAGYVLWSQRGGSREARGLLSRAGLYGLGAALPFGVTCAVLAVAGVFPRFWFWTVRYGIEYASRLTLSQGLERFRTQVPAATDSVEALWVLAGVGLVVVLADSRVRPRAPFVVGWLVCASAGLGTGLYFRLHYFVLVLPVLAVLVGVAAGWARRGLAARRLPADVLVAAVLVAALAWPLWTGRDAYFRAAPRGVLRALYGPNPFPESVEIGRYLRDHTAPDDRVAVLGSEPQIYFYAHRRSATGHIYTYGLMEPHRYALEMQREMIAEIEAARPRYLVWINIPFSWLPDPASHRLIIGWTAEYAARYYEPVGIAEMLPDGLSEIRWDMDVATWRPRSPYRVVVLRRKLP